MTEEETEEELKTFLKDFNKKVDDPAERDTTLQIFSDNVQVSSMMMSVFPQHIFVIINYMHDLF